MEKKGDSKPKPKKERDKNEKITSILIGLMACLAIGVSTARGQVIYSLEDLGVVKDMEASVPAALNNWERSGHSLSGIRRHVPSTTITLRSSWRMPAA